MIHDNSQLKANFLSFLEQQVHKTTRPLTLQIIQIGQNLASAKYVAHKQRMGQKLGIQVSIHHFTEFEDVTNIQAIVTAARHKLQGVIVQLPVSPKFQPVVSSIPAEIDVDMLGQEADKLWKLGYLPPTIGAIDLTLKHIWLSQGLLPGNFEDDKIDMAFVRHKLNLTGFKVAIIGRGKLVGLPAIRYFSERNAEIISVDADTLNPKLQTRTADILVAGVGKKDLIDASWLKPKAIVIDAATSESQGALVGDVNRTSLPEDTTLSPSPGGIGGLTVLYLFYNLVLLTSNCNY